MVAQNNDKRSDGRGANEMRSLILQTNISNATIASGSGYCEMGNTKVLCTITGPRALLRSEDVSSMLGQVVVSVAFMNVASKPKSVGDYAIAELEAALLSAVRPAIMLEKFPKALVELKLDVFEDDGSLFATSINAACGALIDAGIEMYDRIIGASLLVTSTDQVFIDPSGREEKDSAVKTKMAIACMPTHNQICGYLSRSSSMTASEAAELRTTLLGACEMVNAVVRNYTMTDMQKKFPN